MSKIGLFFMKHIHRLEVQFWNLRKTGIRLIFFFFLSLKPFTNQILRGCDMLAPSPSKPSLFQSGPVVDLSSGFLSSLLNTCKKYYRVRLLEHGTWPFQVSESTSNKPTKTIHQSWLPGWAESGCWLTDKCGIRQDEGLLRGKSV